MTPLRRTVDDGYTFETMVTILIIEAMRKVALNTSLNRKANALIQSQLLYLVQMSSLSPYIYVTHKSNYLRAHRSCDNKNDIPTKCAIVARTERQIEGMYRSQHIEAMPIPCEKLKPLKRNDARFFKTRVTLHTNNNCLVQQEDGKGDKPRVALLHYLLCR